MDGISEKARTILIVDDTKLNITMLEKILSAEFITKSATCGSEALKISQETPPDLILLDIVMPEMDGYEVCRALKADAATKNIPVIFVTSLLDPGDETSGFEAGGVDYITKPVIGAVVRSRIKAHLALKDAQEELEGWNSNLKKRLLQSIKIINNKTDSRMSVEERSADLSGYVQSIELISGVFGLMGDRFGVRSRTVSELAGDAARQMNLSAKDVAKIRLAGLLHDVGTLGGSSRGLSEKYKVDMTPAELAEYNKHPERGQELFKSLDDLADVGLMVRGHHEDFAGGGFPDGIRGNDIPLGARLINIAVCLEQSANSVVTDRDEYALKKARQYAGTLLDPALINYFTMITRVLFFEKKTNKYQ
jgi:putative two-component system response regulator